MDQSTDRTQVEHPHMRGPVRALSHGEAERVRDYYAAGVRASALAERYGVSRRTIYRAIEAEGNPVEVVLMDRFLKARIGLADEVLERVAQVAAMLLEEAFHRFQSREATYPPCRGHYDRPPCDPAMPPIRRVMAHVAPEVVVQRLA